MPTCWRQRANPMLARPGFATAAGAPAGTPAADRRGDCPRRTARRRGGTAPGHERRRRPRGPSPRAEVVGCFLSTRPLMKTENLVERWSPTAPTAVPRRQADAMGSRERARGGRPGVAGPLFIGFGVRPDIARSAPAPGASTIRSAWSWSRWYWRSASASRCRGRWRRPSGPRLLPLAALALAAVAIELALLPSAFVGHPAGRQQFLDLPDGHTGAGAGASCGRC